MTGWAWHRKTTGTRMCLVRSSEELQLAAAAAGKQDRIVRRKGRATIKTREGAYDVEYPFWLALDSNGDPYPVACDVYSDTYARVPDKDAPPLGFSSELPTPGAHA